MPHARGVVDAARIAEGLRHRACTADEVAPLVEVHRVERCDRAALNAHDAMDASALVREVAVDLVDAVARIRAVAVFVGQIGYVGLAAVDEEETAVSLAPCNRLKVICVGEVLRVRGRDNIANRATSASLCGQYSARFPALENTNSGTWP